MIYFSKKMHIVIGWNARSSSVWDWYSIAVHSNCEKKRGKSTFEISITKNKQQSFLKWCTFNKAFCCTNLAQFRTVLLARHKFECLVHTVFFPFNPEGWMKKTTTKSSDGALCTNNLMLVQWSPSWANVFWQGGDDPLPEHSGQWRALIGSQLAHRPPPELTGQRSQSLDKTADRMPIGSSLQ